MCSERVFPAVWNWPAVPVQLVPEQSGRQGQSCGGEEQQHWGQAEGSRREAAETQNQHRGTSAESPGGEATCQVFNLQSCWQHFSLHQITFYCYFQDIDINTDDELDAYIEDLLTKGDWEREVDIPLSATFFFFICLYSHLMSLLCSLSSDWLPVSFQPRT